MPQMSPMMWFPMMILFNTMLILTMSLIVTTQYKKLILDKKSVKKTSMTTKW